MDARAAFEIERDRGRGNVAHSKAPERALVELETAEVVREKDEAASHQPVAAQVQQARMIALHIEILGALGVRERRRVDEDQVVHRRMRFQVTDRVGPYQLVLRLVETVELEI